MPTSKCDNQTLTDPMDLCKTLELNPDHYLKKNQCTFPIRVPIQFVDRMKKGNPNDPLLLQVMPRLEEAVDKIPNFIHDPVGDLNSIVENGIIQKYKSRVLLITTGACALHCRYCFRQHFPYSSHTLTAEKIESAMRIISLDSTLSEVILSGGDPLSLSDRRLFSLCQGISHIPHIKRIRIHTRYPIAAPSRIGNAFLTQAAKLQDKLIIVFHVNHANELDTDVKKMVLELKKLHIQLFNQSVLLRGINDDASTLITLSECLFELGILPYYVHILDQVAGAHHFAVEEPKILSIITALQQTLPGYLVPKFVRDLPGDSAKTQVLSSFRVKTKNYPT